MAEIDSVVMQITMIHAAPVSRESHMTKGYYRTAVLLIACTIATPGTSTLFAADADPAASSTIAHLTLDGKPLADLGPHGQDNAAAALEAVAAPIAAASASSQWGRRGGRNSGAATAMFLGAVGAIAGTAVLVYANRPDCSRNASLSGCSYGTKVVGGAVLSAGLVGLIIGAVTWR
jgi:hypothetical protein